MPHHPIQITVTFKPVELTGMPPEELSRSFCVVLDILRATTTILTALAHGARSVTPVSTIAEALARRRQDPTILLAGERGGYAIGPDQTGGIAFDFGNSPREFLNAAIADRSIVMTTTNGTRAIQACRHAQAVLIGGFVNLGTLIRWIVQTRPRRLVLVCAGTGEETAVEDVLGAGAFCHRLAEQIELEPADSALIASQLFGSLQGRLLPTCQNGQNGRRLQDDPRLRGDIPFSLQEDAVPVLARLQTDGSVQQIPQEG